jgi:hypothetical protein
MTGTLRATPSGVGWALSPVSHDVSPLLALVVARSSQLSDLGLTPVVPSVPGSSKNPIVKAGRTAKAGNTFNRGAPLEELAFGRGPPGTPLISSCLA